MINLNPENDSSERERLEKIQERKFELRDIRLSRMSNFHYQFALMADGQLLDPEMFSRPRNLSDLKDQSEEEKLDYLG